MSSVQHQTSILKSCIYTWWWQKGSVPIRRESAGGRHTTVQGQKLRGGGETTVPHLQMKDTNCADKDISTGLPVMEVPASYLDVLKATSSPTRLRANNPQANSLATQAAARHSLSHHRAPHTHVCLLAATQADKGATSYHRTSSASHMADTVPTPATEPSSLHFKQTRKRF